MLAHPPCRCLHLLLYYNDDLRALLIVRMECALQRNLLAPPHPKIIMEFGDQQAYMSMDDGH